MTDKIEQIFREALDIPESEAISDSAFLLGCCPGI